MRIERDGSVWRLPILEQLDLTPHGYKRYGRHVLKPHASCLWQRCVDRERELSINVWVYLQPTKYEVECQIAWGKRSVRILIFSYDDSDLIAALPRIEAKVLEIAGVLDHA